MRTGASDVPSRGLRGQVRPDARLKKTRKTRVRRSMLESDFLEPRTLLATIPGATAAAAPQNISSLFGNVGGLVANQSSVQVAVDPQNPQKMVATWVDNDPTMLAITLGTIGGVIEAAYSTNAGQVWHPFQAEPTSTLPLPVSTEVLDPATTGPTVPYRYATDPSLGFDASDNFYMLAAYHNATDVATSSSGALVLQKYDFSGNTPSQVRFTGNLQGAPYGFGSANDFKIVYQWSSGSFDSAVHPTMQVDSNLPSFTDPVTGDTQTDPFSGDVYISWAGIDIKPSLVTNLTLYNPNRIKLVVSSDGGNNFTGQAITSINSQQPDNDNGPTTERNTLPALTVSQGRLPNESGQGGDAGIPGGQVAVTWDNFGDGHLMANTVSAGRNYSFGGAVDTIPWGATTDFPNTVSIPDDEIAELTNLTVTVNIVHSNDSVLGLTLVAPSGDTFSLFVNQTVGSTTNTGVGLSGTNLGMITYTNNNIGTYAIGTTFDDNATRNIFDPNTGGTNANTAPYIGNYRPERSFGGGTNTLNGFLRQEIAKGIDGAWKLRTIDTATSAPAATSPQFIQSWTLNFTRGLRPDSDDVTLPGTATNNNVGGVVPGSISNTFSTASAASPVGISPGVVMAQDNTLGSFSPHQGRIYAAYVGYTNITVNNIKNPADNTDIFMTFSDDGGRSWSAPQIVNDDVSFNDGFSESNDNPFPLDQVTGRVQFQPAIAVDQVTGTLVLSWRDGRDDTARARTADYITASIDGGQTFNTQTYANPAQTAVDAITGATDVLGPMADNNSSGNSNRDGTYGFGSSMGLAVYDGKVYPVWSTNFNQADVVNNAIQGEPMSVYIRPMVIAAGPRVVTSDQGPIVYPAVNGTISFNITFDRPINPPNGTTTFLPGDVEVFYHDTTNGTASIPLRVTGISPITSSGVGPGNKFGFTQFRVTFDPNTKAGGGASGITNFTGTYSYLIAPDNGSQAIASPIPAFVIAPFTKPDVSKSSGQVNLRIPTSGSGGSGTSDDITTSRITLSGHPNQLITSITVNMSLSHERGSDLTITLLAPDGRSTLVFQGTSNAPLTIPLTQDFTLNALNGGQVDGIYSLIIDDSVSNNTGQLNSWSITVSSELPTFGQQNGAPMDQNADGIADQNAVTTSFTGLTPGDVYASPMPQPTSPFTFFGAASILRPPFNQNSLPLIVAGPHVVSTSVTGGQGSDNLVVNGTNGAISVTFDRLMQASTFTPDDVLSIMGPTGSVSGPQFFASDSVGQTIPAASSATSAGVLNSTLTIPSFNGTFKIKKITVQLNAAFPNDAGLAATLIAPDGTSIPLFANGTLSGSNFVNTILDDAASNALTSSTATGPYSGTFKPSGSLSSLAANGGRTVDIQNSAGQWVPGVWTLRLTNSKTGTSGTLGSWSLNITPVISVAPQTGTASTFTVNFPQQQLSGTYTIQLSPNILDTHPYTDANGVSHTGQALDTNQNAGLDVLRGQSQNGPTTTVLYNAADLPKPILRPPRPARARSAPASSSRITSWSREIRPPRGSVACASRST